MPKFHSSSVLSFALIFACAGWLTAQQQPRIGQRVDNTRITRLGRTTHPLTGSWRDLGPARADLRMERIQMQLSSSPEQEAALEQLLAGQQDPASPHFQEWLTPEQFGERFGPAQQDIDTIVRWLQDEGFHVDGIGRGRRTLEFSGTASQVESAFHTQIRQYEVNGERHLANSTDVAIPEAFATVIGGVVSLHDFRSKPMHRVLGRAPTPATDFGGGVHGLSPFDFAAIYNLTPLWNTAFNGAGQSVAIAGRTNINLADVTLFRSHFGLPVNNAQVILNGADPGIVSAREETEADLDVEWSGGVAKGAAIKFVVSASTISDGVYLSSAYIVNNNVAPVMSVSFALCETFMGSGNQAYNSLWQQAAAQGISVFVSAGDSGSAGCDNPNLLTPASLGLGVNGLASTPYNVAVGGTQFADTANPAAYWNLFNDSNYASAMGFIPETAWNESSYTTANDPNNSLFAGSGGVSSLYATPLWQTGAGVPTADPGAPTQHHRYLPDVSLTAGRHDGYLIYQEGVLYLVGGTSASSPSFAGIMAIVDQYTGGRNGNPNRRFYSLATQAPAAYHDVTTGTSAVPCAGGSPGCSTPAPAGNTGVMTGYAAARGYDLATGLGSVDAFALALNWGVRLVSGSPSLPLTSDFDGDGHEDAIWQDPVSGLVQIWRLGGGPGTGMLGAVNLTARNTWRVVGVRDFNQDGHPDVVWQDPVSGAAQVWFLGGPQGNVLLGAASLSAGNSWRIMSVADFNGDGRPDVIWQDPVTGLAQIWLMGGAQGVTLTGAVNLTASNKWRIVGTGDFNQDGHPDVLWQDPVSGSVQVWYLNGVQGNVVFDSVNLTGSNPWRIASVGDYNGDGHPDVLWQDPVSGTSQAWFLGGLKGTTVIGSSAVSGPNPWRIVGPR